MPSGCCWSTVSEGTIPTWTWSSWGTSLGWLTSPPATGSPPTTPTTPSRTPPSGPSWPTPCSPLTRGTSSWGSVWSRSRGGSRPKNGSAGDQGYSPRLVGSLNWVWNRSGRELFLSFFFSKFWVLLFISILYFFLNLKLDEVTLYGCTVTLRPSNIYTISYII